MGMQLKTRRTLLAGAIRTATATCPLQQDAVEQHVRVYLNVTAASGTGGLKVVVRGYDIVSGLPAALNAGGAAAKIAPGLFVYELMRSDALPVGNVVETVGRGLPCVWDVQVTHGDASNYAYSLSCEVLPG